MMMATKHSSSCKAKLTERSRHIVMFTPFQINKKDFIQHHTTSTGHQILHYCKSNNILADPRAQHSR